MNHEMSQGPNRLAVRLLPLTAAHRMHADGDWESAAEACAYRERPYEQALALADGDVPARLAALQILDDLDADPLATRIRRELRRDGVRNIPLGPRPRHGNASPTSKRGSRRFST